MTAVLKKISTPTYPELSFTKRTSLQRLIDLAAFSLCCLSVLSITHIDVFSPSGILYKGNGENIFISQQPPVISSIMGKYSFKYNWFVWSCMFVLIMTLHGGQLFCSHSLGVSHRNLMGPRRKFLLATSKLSEYWGVNSQRMDWGC